MEVGAFRREVCGDSPIIDKWMYALKNLSRLEERPAALRERVFARLFEAAKIAAYTKEERNQYENDMMTENDYRNTIDYARDEGRAEGHAAGLAEGEARGRAEGALQASPRIREARGLDSLEIRGLSRPGRREALMLLPASRQGAGTPLPERTTERTRRTSMLMILLLQERPKREHS